MPSKYKMIMELASQTARDVTANAETYTDFLVTAANNYKYSFKEQLLIFAQKPDATACADIETWNRLGLWVNKGTKGIALLVDRDVPYKLRHVFDVSDTNSRAGRTITLWQMRPEYEDAVLESLRNSFGEIDEPMDFPRSLIEIAGNAVQDNLSDYLADLVSVKGDSLLEELDETSLEMWLKTTLKNSVAYMALSRAGYDPNRYFGVEDFDHVYDFNTPETISVLGAAASDISEMVLRDMGETVKEQEKEKRSIRTFEGRGTSEYHNTRNESTERSSDYGTDLHHAGGLYDSQPDRPGEPEAWEIWNAAANIPAPAQGRDLHRNDAERNTEQPSSGGGRAGQSDDGAAHNGDEAAVRRDRTAESGRSDEVGADDERDPSLGGGSSSGQPDLRITLPTVEEQQERIAEAEDEKSSAFVISQEDIDAVLTRGGGIHESKYRIYEQYLKQEPSESNISFLKNEYGVGGAYPAVASRNLDESHDSKGIKISRGRLTMPNADILLSWNRVEKRIGELIAGDRYLSQAELDYYPTYREQEDARRARWDISNEFRSIVYDYNDFVEQLGEKDKVLNLYYLSSCWGAFGVGDKKMHARTMEGDYILPMMRDAMNTIIAENTHLTQRCEAMLEKLSGEIARPLEPTEEELNPSPKEYQFHLGDTVYLGVQEYEIISFDEKEVVLYDTQYPLFQKTMPREEFENRLRENPLNDRLLQEVEESPIPDAEEVLTDEELDELPVSVVEDGEVVTYPNSEAMLDAMNDAEETTIAPPPKQVRTGKATPHVLHPEISSEQRSNFRIDNDNIGVGTPLERFYHNIHAIELLNRLEQEQRFATPYEQLILAEYVGWGGLSEFFKEDNPHYSELKALLSEDEYASARESTLTAFYTPPVVIRGIYQALENMNFKTGNVLEPSCGIGNFMGLVPDSMSSAKFYGVELDSISGRIAQQLYQNSSIAVQGFEEASLPDSFFDAAVGNVPFGQFKVPDKRYDKHNFLIHDYFFARTLDKVRPGGVVAFVTSKGTMDKENPSVRKYIAQRADLLGAIRLPNNTFKDAAGTEVTSDIIFLQKRNRLIDIEPDWVHLGTDENGIKMNSYFVSNPDMILGDMQLVSGAHGMEPACIAYEGADLGELLQDAIQNIHAEIADYEVDTLEADEEDRSIPADPDVRNFSFTISDGTIYFRENSRMNPVEVSATAESRIRGMIGIRDCVRTLIEYQTEDYPDSDIKAEQEKLNTLYDAFSKKYGLINSRANNSTFSSDSSYCLLSSLEVLDDEGNFVRKADMFTKRTIKQKVQVTSVDTASEAYALSLAEKARVDMDYMSSLTGKTEEELFADLRGVIFLNPMHGYGDPTEQKYLPADEYLSGNVREKLQWAKRSAELSPEDYAENVTALEAVQPVDLSASEISVRLGATWLPTEIVEQFMFELFDTPRYCQWNIHVHFSSYTGEWNVEGKSYDRGNVKAYNAYGTSRINGYKIMEETLNLKDVRIFDYVEDENGRKTAILNKKETAIAQGKQELIKQAFADWIWADPERRERLTKMYNEKFNSIRPREYDGSHMSFAGINPEITLRPHQVNAIAHIIYGGNTLLAHVVGAGKTFEMVAAAQESKRLGLCQKSLFVVPNHLTEQWASEYLQLYPAANILVATKKDFETKNRKKFCGRIATGDYDAVIIGHSQFEKIPMSIERQRAILEQQLDEILDGIAELKRNRGDNFSIKQLERTKKTVKQKLDKLNDQSRKDDVVTFEELGVDRIFVDEAHYYKNLAAFTKMRNVGGISQTEAMKSSDLYMKCRYLDELTGGRGVVFATGTPISNSMVELYTMQKYLQYGTLKRNDLIHFDAWASTFGETVTAIELAPEGTGYRAKTRFAKFYNLPELMAMFRETADIQTADMLKLPVPEAHYHHVVLKPSETQREMVAGLSERAERVRNKMVDSSEDNMLLITNDGRKLALDQRLMNDMLPDSETSKVAACAENVYAIWQQTESQRSTQMVFCDLSTPHGDGTFNVYDDLRAKLMAKGIPAEEIAYIHSAGTEAQKKELFGKVRSGQVRVLIGSTQKMGAGTNVQTKLVALHHLDCPWRPSDLQQREGRIIRQGNENTAVDIYTYVTENTFDSYLYQLVESKQKFIGQIMTSKSPVRSAEDVDETALSYAEIKALCAGDPHIKEKMDLDIDVSRLKLLKASHLSQRYALEDQILKEFPQKIRSLEQRLEGFQADIDQLKRNTLPGEDGFSPMILAGGTVSDKKAAGEGILALCKSMTSPEAIHIGEYRGFDMELSFDSLSREYKLTLKHELRHTVSLGTDIYGNIMRLDNALSALPERMRACEEQLENTRTQMENAKVQVQKPFPQEEELQTKTERLNELNALLNLDKAENEIVDGERSEEEPQRSKEDKER
jgi:N12 class adenine-specific DNA methylase/adenine-specific DNA methylase